MKIKTLLLAACVTALAFTGLAQVTNTTAISALTSVGSITGSELIPVVQGGVTMKATAGQIQSAPSAAAPAVQTFATGVSNQLVSATNLLYTSQIASNSAALAALAATNAALLTAISTTNAAERTAMNLSNSIAIATIIASNSVAMNALAATNTAIQAQISALQVSAGQTNISTINLTNATVNRLMLPTYQAPSISFPVNATITTNVDFSKGTFQRIFVGMASSACTLLFAPTNFADGDNVWLDVVVTNSQAGTVGTATSVPGGTLNYWSASGAALSGSKKETLLNWQVMGTNNLMFTQAIHP